MFDSILSCVQHAHFGIDHSNDHHVLSAFPGKHDLFKAMGLNASQKGPILYNTVHMKDCPVEYIIRVNTPPPTKSADGILLSTGAPHSTPNISIIGTKGRTSSMALSSGMRAGTLNEFSLVGNDVGQINGIQLSNHAAGKDTWTPSRIDINHIKPSGTTQTRSLPSGWVHFDINRAITNSQVFGVSPKTLSS